jgi:hypothetical protein
MGALEMPLVPAKVGTQFFLHLALDARLRGNERSVGRCL